MESHSTAEEENVLFICLAEAFLKATASGSLAALSSITTMYWWRSLEEAPSYLVQLTNSGISRFSSCEWFNVKSEFEFWYSIRLNLINGDCWAFAVVCALVRATPVIYCRNCLTFSYLQVLRTLQSSLTWRQSFTSHISSWPSRWVLHRYKQCGGRLPPSMSTLHWI